MKIDTNSFYKVPTGLYELWLNKEISTLAYMIYPLFLKRSQITKFMDEKGNKYFIYSQEEISKTLGKKRKQTIIDAINELEKFELIKTKKINGKATMYYLNQFQK